jgi:isocitrate dehydrogenase
VLKGPITTPLGGGYKSLNVTLRKSLGLFANIRPAVGYHPFVPGSRTDMNLVVVRENEEDTYGGIEHRQTPEMTQCLKLISEPGTRRLVRYAFEYAREHGRKKLSCFTKSNIMKLTDGLFQRIFEEISRDYPELETEHLIIDIGTAKLASEPSRFDVIVTPNLYGDIVSDVTAQLSGSVGLAGSANIGRGAAMFEAVHGSAPDIAGKDLANPSGMIQAAAMMLEHVGQGEVAARLQNAWLRTMEDGVLTPDLTGHVEHPRVVGTRRFGEEVAKRLGQEPGYLPKAAASARRMIPTDDPRDAAKPRPAKQLAGVDVFLDWDEAGRSPDALGTRLSESAGPEFVLKMITNRGVKVYPEGNPETFCTDHWRCRFGPAEEGRTLSRADVIALLGRIDAAGLDFIKTEHLYTFDGERGYSLGQGE